MHQQLMRHKEESEMNYILISTLVLYWLNDFLRVSYFAKMDHWRSGLVTFSRLDKQFINGFSGYEMDVQCRK